MAMADVLTLIILECTQECQIRLWNGSRTQLRGLRRAHVIIDNPIEIGAFVFIE